MHPIVNATNMTTAQDGLSKVGFNHQTIANALITTLTIRRPNAKMVADAREKFDAILRESVIEPAADLHEVQSYFALRDKFAPIDNEVERLAISIETIDIEKKRAALDLNGEELLTTLNKLEAERKECAKQIENAKAGQALFQQEVAESLAAARAAIKAFVPTALSAVYTANNAAIDAAKQAFFESDLIILADKMATVDRVARMFRTGNIERALDDVLKDPK